MHRTPPKNDGFPVTDPCIWYIHLLIYHKNQPFMLVNISSDISPTDPMAFESKFRALR